MLTPEILARKCLLQQQALLLLYNRSRSLISAPPNSEQREMLSSGALPEPEMASPCSWFNTLPVSWVAPDLGPLLGDEAALALAVGLRGRVK